MNYEDKFESIANPYAVYATGENEKAVQKGDLWTPNLISFFSIASQNTKSTCSNKPSVLWSEKNGKNLTFLKI